MCDKEDVEGGVEVEQDADAVERTQIGVARPGNSPRRCSVKSGTDRCQELLHVRLEAHGNKRALGRCAPADSIR